MIDDEKRIEHRDNFPPQEKRLALVVGVNTSIKSVYLETLSYAEDDAYEMAKALGSSACGFTLLKPALKGKEATTRDVTDAIIELINKSTPQDFLCFYFSGHAKPMRVKAGEHQDIYLVTHDFDESQVKIDPTHHLSMRWLWEVLYQRTNVGKILLILDCCYAGNMLVSGPDPFQIDLRKLFLDEEEEVKTQTDRSRVILSATGHDGAAHERDGHGIMTGLLLKALRGEVTSAYDEEGYLHISALYTYLQKAMPEQPPNWSNEGRGKFILAWRLPKDQVPDDEAEKNTKVLITDADLLNRLAKITSKGHSLPFDHTLCGDASLTDINMESVASLFQKERVQKQHGFHSNMTNQELLEHLNLLREGVLTYGAVLCFGKNPSRWVAEAFTRCISYKGNDRRRGWEEDQEFRGSLLEQYALSMAFLQKNLRLIRVSSAEGSIELWEIPLVVLREALANALIHREYADQRNCVRVEIFDNRIEISSPGGLLGSLTIEQLGLEGQQYPLRNPQIAHIFYLCNYVEKLGTGISRMQEEMEKVQLPEPRFDPSDGRTFKVILRRPQRIELGTMGEPFSFSSGDAEPDPMREPSLSSGGAEPEPMTASPFSSRVGVFVIKRRYQLLSLVLVTILVTTLFILAFSGIFTSTNTGIDIINEPNNEQIGLSDGTYAFDTGTDRADASLKKQAAAKFAQGDKVGATSLWNQAVGKNGIDTNDAEALIYLEDQRVLVSGSPYITLVVGTMLSGNQNKISSGRDDLQGAYVEQKEYNDGLKLSSGTLVRLLIASAGSKSDYATEVARLIVKAQQHDSTIVGVMGWAFSSYTQKAIPVLTHAHIPMVSSTASADSLSGTSTYFFRVAPPDRSQAIVGVKYAEQQLHASRVALFVDPNDTYSSSLANDFKRQFVADGNQIVDTETYTVGDKANLSSYLQNALNSHPDLIYFSGYADDLAVLLVNFPTSLPNLQVLGGDGLYTPNAYPSTAKLGFSRVHFTTFAYPDEWSILGMKEPPFFSEYPADFNPAHVDHSANPYGFIRADFGIILAYDATHALLQGCQNALAVQNVLTLDALRNGLTQITDAKAIQGVSGRISFGSNGDPIDKAVVILYVDQDDHIHLLEKNGVQGCFIIGQCG